MDSEYLRTFVSSLDGHCFQTGKLSVCIGTLVPRADCWIRESVKMNRNANRKMPKFRSNLFNNLH